MSQVCGKLISKIVSQQQPRKRSEISKTVLQKLFCTQVHDLLKPSVASHRLGRPLTAYSWMHGLKLLLWLCFFKFFGGDGVYHLEIRSRAGKMVACSLRVVGGTLGTSVGKRRSRKLTGNSARRLLLHGHCATPSCMFCSSVFD